MYSGNQGSSGVSVVSSRESEAKSSNRPFLSTHSMSRTPAPHSNPLKKKNQLTSCCKIFTAGFTAPKLGSANYVHTYIHTARCTGAGGHEPEKSPTRGRHSRRCRAASCGAVLSAREVFAHTVYAYAHLRCVQELHLRLILLIRGSTRIRIHTAASSPPPLSPLSPLSESPFPSSPPSPPSSKPATTRHPVPIQPVSSHNYSYPIINNSNFKHPRTE